MKPHQITLLGRIYYVARDMNGAPCVIVQQSALIWRPASPLMAHNVLAGMNVEAVRNG